MTKLCSLDWYIKGKYKCYYAHQIGISQLAGSGAPVGCVVLNGKQYEPDSLKPLLEDVVEEHPSLSIEKVNTQPCRETSCNEDEKMLKLLAVGS